MELSKPEHGGQNNREKAFILKEKEIASSERHENIEMLTCLLEKLQEYNRKIADRNKKRAAMKAAEAELAGVKTKMTRGALIGRIVLLALIAVAALIVSDFDLGTALIVLAILSLLIVLLVRKYRRCTREFEAQFEHFREQLANAKAAYEQACTAVQDYFDWTLKPYIQEIVPERFPEVYVMDVYAVEQMLNLLINLRADTIKEVINLYEYIRYQNNMDHSLSYIKGKVDSIANSSARSAVASERTAAASERTATASEITAVSTATMAAHQKAQTKAMERGANAIEREADAIEREASAIERITE